MTTTTTTFYLVMSAEGLEGSFTSEADADAYRRELRAIGIARLRIERKEIPTPRHTGEPEPCGQPIDAAIIAPCEKPAGHTGPCRAFSLELRAGSTQKASAT